MVNLFDGLESAAFDIVTNTMGYDAVWIPSNGSYPTGYNARVLFKNPDDNYDLSNGSYSSLNYTIEYRLDFFPQLKEIVDTHGTYEIITVNGIEYYVRSIVTKYDGKTYIATLEIKP